MTIVFEPDRLYEIAQTFKVYGRLVLKELLQGKL